MDPQRLEQIKELLLRLAITYGPKLLVGIAFLILGSIAARWVGAVVSNWLEKRQMEPPVRLLLSRIMRAVVLAFFILMALTNLDIQLGPLLAGLGVAGVGIGLALQGVLQNLVAGLTIIFTKPFRVGEYIALVGVEGEVVMVELFATTLRHADQSRVVIPNRKIVGEILHNYGTIRQLDLMVGVAYETDLNQAVRVIREILAANLRVLKDLPPVVGVSKLDDSSVTLAVKPWVKVGDFGPAGAELYQAILARFRAANISIPSPQCDVRLVNRAA